MDNVKCYYATHIFISLVSYVPNDGFLLSQNTMHYNHKRYKKKSLVVYDIIVITVSCTI
jgi:hypothetical protein